MEYETYDTDATYDDMNEGIKGKVTDNRTTTSGESNAGKETWRKKQFLVIAILLVVIVLLQSASLTVSLITRSGEGDIEKELRNTTDILKDEAHETVTTTTTTTTMKTTTTTTTNATATAAWTTEFSQSGDYTIKNKETLTNLIQRAKEWRVSFEFKPTSLGQTQYIFKFGSHDPSFYIMSSNKLRVHFDLHGKNTYKDFSEWELGKWTRLEFEQVKQGNGGYYITISMNEKLLYKSRNSSPEEKSNISVIYGGQAGKIRSIVIENKDN